jgi:N-acetylglucosamine kinase-like BadF-type ATPase
VHDAVLGIDGGGTGTIAVLAERAPGGDTAVLGRGVSGPANPRSIGFPASFAALEEAVAAAFHQAGIAPGPVAAACLALAGAGREIERQQFDHWAQSRRLAARFVQVHDALPVLAAGSPEGWGIALIAGTGSLAFGRNRQGETARAGGWGYLFGDEGSAYSMAVNALRTVAQSADGRQPATLLTPRIMSALGVSAPHELVDAVYGRLERAQIAALAQCVTETAAAGDVLANRIMQQAADQLAEMVAAVASRIGLGESPFPLALAGGALTSSVLLRNRLEAAIRQRGMSLGPVSVVSEPALGAARLARELVAGD